MAGSFKLDAGGDQDNVLTLVLLALTAVFTIVNVWVNLFGVVLFVGPVIVFIVARFAYKRHFRKRIALLESSLPEAI